MAKNTPFEIDEYFMLGILLIFLMINYNLNLSSIYSHMTTFMILMYLVPLIFNLFSWSPILNKKKKTSVSTMYGVGAGVIFIMFYGLLKSASPIQQVFATTAFGESEIIGQIVFGFLIPIIETIFFFRILKGWLVYLLGFKKDLEPFSKNGLMVNVSLSAIFTIFHATAKGVSNNIDLIATFVFAFASVALIMYFKHVWEALLMHIVVNSKSVGLTEMLLSTNGLIFVGIIYGIYYFLFSNKKKINLFG